MEEKITITLEEYKELLIIKGKYEELKNNQPLPHIYPSQITYTDDKGKQIKYPYKITCGSCDVNSATYYNEADLKGQIK